MKIRRFFGKDMRDALKQVKDELGGEAVIMSNKKVANGVELVAAIDPTPAKQSKSEVGEKVVDESQKQPNSRPSGAKPTPSLREIVGDSGPDSLQALLEQQMNYQNKAQETAQPDSAVQNNRDYSVQSTENTNNLGQENNIGHRKSQPFNDESNTFSNNSPSAQHTKAQDDFTRGQINNNQPSSNHYGNEGTDSTSQQSKSLHYSQQENYGVEPQPRADERIFRSPAFADMQDFNPSSQEVNLAKSIPSNPPPSVLEPEQLDVIKAELESIKNVLKFQVSELADERKKRNNPVHHYINEKLQKMGLSAPLSRQFAKFLPHNVDQTQGWKYVLNLLSNRIQVGNNDILTQSGIVALVGPTGTGKTTTLAKLAARYAQKFGPEQVALVTIDTYRIAAFEQLATYGKIIGCAVKKAHNAGELNNILHQMRNKKLVLIDTAGFSQRDSRLIDQLNEYDNQVSAKIRKYLVVPAGAQYQVLNQTVKAYSSIALSGCIFSKLDECYSLGEALSVVIENDISLSYVTDGQRVPEDIKLADSANLTLIAAKLFKRYGDADEVELSTTSAGIL